MKNTLFARVQSYKVFVSDEKLKENMNRDETKEKNLRFVYQST